MTYPNDPTATSGQQAADSIRGPATEVTDTATAEARNVAETAKHEARQLTAEGKYQGRRVLDEGVAELKSQASTVQARLAQGLQDLSDELRQMTAAGGTNGTVAGLADQAQDYTARAATWLRDNDLDSAMYGVRRFAARNPWGFLALAAGAGLVAGRLARGVRDAASPDGGGQLSGYGGVPRQVGTTYPDVGVDRPTSY